MTPKILVLLFALMTGLPCVGLAAPTNGLPFCPGERLVYALNWEAVNAGEASIEVLPVAELEGGAKALHFRMNAKTNSFVDIFYKVRDEVNAYTDLNLTQSLLYLKRQREGSYERDITVKFYWDRLKAQYSNTLNGPKEPITVYPGTFDPLSVFYSFRIMPLETGAELMSPVTDGVKMVLGKATVIEEAQVKVPAGTFETFLVEPDLSHVGGVFKKSKNAKLKIWVTKDKRRIPVRISSKVIVGRFFAELVEINAPAQCYESSAAPSQPPTKKP